MYTHVQATHTCSIWALGQSTGGLKICKIAANDTKTVSFIVFTHCQQEYIRKLTFNGSS